MGGIKPFDTPKSSANKAVTIVFIVIDGMAVKFMFSVPEILVGR